MWPRRVLVKSHRWLAFALMAWLVVIALSGAWLVTHDAVESWIHPDRYRTTEGDVGPEAARDAAVEAVGEDASIYGPTMPGNGRGVYQVYAEIPLAGAPEPEDGAEAPHRHVTVYVDPGSGRVNATKDDEAGMSWWLYRGHMYLWQDHGVFGVFDPETGWCRVDGRGAEPGGVKGVVCDLIPNGGDMVSWFGVGWIVVLFTGFYLWYWPGVKRWARAFKVERKRGPFTFNLSLHKVIGFVVWVPLTIIAFTGIAFAFPDLKGWYENVTPAQRNQDLWVAPDDASTSEKANGRDPIGLDRFVEIVQEELPDRTVEYVEAPADKKGVYGAWVTRGFSPWTREGGAGNVWVTVDQYTGAVLYDGTPEEGNAFDQLWSDWSFPLHTGDFGGTVTRVLWVGAGLSPLVLGITGIAMYVIRLRKRRRAAARTAVAPQQPEDLGTAPGIEEAEHVPVA